MKLLLAFLSIIMLSSIPLLAQEEQESDLEKAERNVEQKVDQAVGYVDRNFEFGARFGVNFSSFNNNQVFNADTQTGFLLGVYTRFLFTKRLSGKVELLYSVQGARADEFAIFKDFSINLNYLALPLLAEINVGNKLTLELGPYIAVLLSNRQSFSKLIPAVRDEVTLSEDETNFVDVGFAVGANYSLGDGIGVGARYNQGFTDALGNDFFQGASGSNTVIQAAVTYTF